MFQATLRLYKNAYSGLPQAVWWLSLVIFINRMGTMVIPFLMLYITSKGYSTTQAGYVFTIFGSGTIIGAMLGGRLTDKFGFFYVQVVSLLINGTLLILVGKMSSIIGISVSVFLAGIVGEAFRPANSTAIANFSNPSNLTRSYSLNRLAINLGWAFGMAIGGILTHASYSLMFWTDGLCCIAAGITLYFLFRSYNRNRTVKKDVGPIIKLRSAWQDRIFMFGITCLFLVAFCFFQVLTILPVYYRDALHFENYITGTLMAMNGIIIALLEMILVYKMERRSSPVIFMMGGAILIGISFLVLNVLPGLGIAVLGILFATFGEMLLFPFANNFWVNRSNERNRGQYAGIYTMAFSAAFVIAPMTAAVISDNLGFSYLWIINFIICSVAASGYYLLQKKIDNESIQPHSTTEMV